MPKNEEETGDSSAPQEQRLHPVRSGDQEVYVSIPVSEDTDLEEVAQEASYYLETLQEHQRVAEEPDPLGPEQTHRIETDEEGRRVLRRKRFTAI